MINKLDESLVSVSSFYRYYCRVYRDPGREMGRSIFYVFSIVDQYTDGNKQSGINLVHGLGGFKRNEPGN